MTAPTDARQAAREAADLVVSAANIVSHDGYYEIGLDAASMVIERAILAERQRAAEEIAQWYATTGWQMDEDDVPDAIRALPLHNDKTADGMAVFG